MAERPWLKSYPPGVPAEIEVPNKSIPEIFDEASEKYADKTALIFYGRKISYRELRENVDRFATALHDLGVKKGERVALYLPNCPQFVISYFGILKTGATVTPISPVYVSKEVAYQLKDSEAKTIICLDTLFENVEKTGLKLDRIITTNIGEYLPSLKKFIGKSLLGKLFRKAMIPSPKIPKREGIYHFQELLKKYPPNPPKVKINPSEDLAALPYSGGTTGIPKGVMVPHRNIVANMAQIRAFWPILEEGKEVVVAFLPFYHIYGQVVALIFGLCWGSTLVLFTTFDPDEILDAIEKYNATVFNGVPTVFEFLKDYEKTLKVNWKRLKLITSGADVLHPSTYQDWEKKTGARIIQGYGLTETSTVTHSNPYHKVKADSFGIPLPSTLAAIAHPEKNQFLKVGEIGEVVIHGPQVMKGYWKNPEETKKVLVKIEGKTWLRTGDLAKMDEEGYFYFFERKKDLIKYKGFSIYAREIEDVLYEHPQIKEAAVIGVPHPQFGEIVKAYVVLHTEARGKVSEEDIIEYCKKKLAPYKVPKIVEFRGELPKTDVGKISHRELREEVKKA
ncbi:MAG: long-chain fatty acid--CoA ligase [Candidatus Hadarchaeales archaeon]